MNLNEVRQYLESQQTGAKKHLGQNFLIEQHSIDKIVRLMSIERQDRVLEIGPGMGALTESLCRAAGTVYAYEIDQDMVDVLHDRLGAFNNLVLNHQDFLKADLGQFKHQPIKVCANIPYYITTPILLKLVHEELDITMMSLMVQKEIAERLMAQPRTKAYSSLSILFQYYFEIKKGFTVKASCFYPRPKVDSMVINFVSRKVERLDPNFFEFIHRCFNHRRKTVVNNLKMMDCQVDVSQAGIKATLRPEELVLEDYQRLWQLTGQSALICS